MSNACSLVRSAASSLIEPLGAVDTSGKVGIRSADFGGAWTTDWSATGGGLITPPDSRNCREVTPPSCASALGGTVLRWCCFARSLTCSRQVAPATLVDQSAAARPTQLRTGAKRRWTTGMLLCRSNACLEVPFLPFPRGGPRVAPGTSDSARFLHAMRALTAMVGAPGLEPGTR